MMKLRPVMFAALGFSLFLVPASRADFITSIEPPGVQTSSAANTTTIDFDSVSQGYHYTQNFSLPGSLTASLQGDQFITGANKFGGAGGTGNFLSLQQGTSVSLSLSSPQAYFGAWLSALDAYNHVEIYRGDTLVGSFSANGIENTGLPDSYFGNPTDPFSGQNMGEHYAFVNFYATTEADMFDKIVFTNDYGGGTGFEMDNFTFSTTIQPPSVPEPSTLASSGIALILLSGTWLRKRSRRPTSIPR